MGYCKKFINGISQINFSEISAKVVRDMLFSSACQELEKEQESINKKLLQLPVQITENDNANKLLQAYKESQREILQVVKEQLTALKETAQQEKINLTQAVIINADFIKDFANNFRNIRHLSDTLSDAPSIIKNVQTQLFTEILFKLDKVEQEKQLQTLSLNNLQDMLQQAIVIFDRENDKKIQAKCRNLVSMAIYEIVRRDCQKTANSAEKGLGVFEDLLRTLELKLPDVKQSSIIDSLNEYQNSDGQTINSQLQTAAKKLNATSGDWLDENWQDCLIQKKSLLHKLRFGQEDRREYARKTRENLARELFWARNIRDVELFTKQGVSDEVYAGLEEKRLINRNNIYSPEISKLLPNTPKNLTVSQKRLAQVINAVKNSRIVKTNNTVVERFPLGKKVSNKQEKIIDDELTTEMGQKFNKPTVSLSINNRITITFYATSLSPKVLRASIIKAGGFSYNPETLVSTELKDTIDKKIYSLTLYGSSLADIERQLNNDDSFADIKRQLNNDQSLNNIERELNNDDSLADNERPLNNRESLFNQIKTSYKNQLELVKQYTKNPKIDSLKLTNSDELLLRKLLELRFIYPGKGVNFVTDDSTGINVPAILNASFAELAKGNAKEALKTEALEQAIDAAYQQLALIDEQKVMEQIRPMVSKSKLIHTSSLQRKEKLNKLNNTFAAQRASEEKIKAIETIFLSEYLDESMVNTLSLTTELIERVKKDIHIMAADIVRLQERTEQGLPALTLEEQEAYFSVIRQIARAISPESLNNVRFKINYGSQHVWVVNELTGKRTKVDIDTNDISLPYSLIKPPFADFIFSYGGSRGVIAPFEGLDKALSDSKTKGRFFTHSRLLGVGQYGSVKEVESLLTGLNQVIKKGYVPAETPTFSEESRKNLRTRPISARNDPLYRIESDILQNISNVQKNEQSTTQYWIEDDKLRPAGSLFSQTNTPRQYQLLTERAKGDTLADTANSVLNQYTKAEIAYHNPTQRSGSEKDLKNSLALSRAIVDEAQKFQQAGFSHNDIKPENLLYKLNPDGSYQVRYIDWATGGFIQQYTGALQEPLAVFQKIFGNDLNPQPVNNGYADKNGRFVTKNEKGQINYGVNPTLQILHGARNGTLPYISPQVLNDKKEGEAVDTRLENNAPEMDNWALTAMVFGICNRLAYFELVKGRAVADYEVPGVLEADNDGLKIINDKKFTEFFAVKKDSNTVTAIKLSQDPTSRGLSAGSNPGIEQDFWISRTSRGTSEMSNTVMYIPSNQREGEPLHLYHRLQKLRDELTTKQDKPSQAIVSDLNKILDTAYQAVASGKGLTKNELTSLINKAQDCIKNYEKLNDNDFQQSLKKSDMLQAVFNEFSGNKAVTIQDLLMQVDGVSKLAILCTYPLTNEQQGQAVNLLDKALDGDILHDNFLSVDYAPGYPLFRQAIIHGQDKVVISLLNKVNHNDFAKLVINEGLLHLAAEKGLTNVFGAVIDALQRIGTSKKDILDLMLYQYGPLNNNHSIQWSTDCFHIAIRNNNREQLLEMMHLLPAGKAYDDTIYQALHLCAVLGNKALFNLIKDQYNQLNPQDPIDAKTIINDMVFAPDDSSPYHLFLQDETTSDVLDWIALSNDAELTKNFLLTAPKNTRSYPLLIAAKHSNFKAVDKLLLLPFKNEDWQQLIMQRDEAGKNLLNYILEQKDFDQLNKIIKLIQQQQPEQFADVLIDLLANPQPVNALTNFLNDSNIDNHKKFIVFTQIMDAICADFTTASVKQQQARVVALLINQDWLVHQTEHKANHLLLRNLIQNNALSLPFKRLILQNLVKTAGENKEATAFYNLLLKEITAPINVEEEKKFTLAIPAIMKEVARQQANLDLLIDALLSDYEAIKKYEEEAKELQNKITAYQENAEKAFASNQQLEQSSEELKNQSTLLQEELNRLQEKNRELVIKVNLSEELNSKQKSEYTEALEVAKKSTKQSELLLSETKEQLESAQLFNKTLQSRLATLDEKLTEKDQQISRLEENLNESKRLLKDANQTTKQLQEEIARLDNIEQLSKESKLLLDQELQQLKSELVGANEISLKLKIDLDEKEQELMQAQDESKQIKANFDATILDLTAQISALNNQKQLIEKELDSKVNSLSITNQEVIERLHETEHTFTNKLKELSVKLMQEQESSTEIRSNLESMTQQNTQLLKNISSLNNLNSAEKTALQDQLAKLQEETILARQEVLSLEQELSNQLSGLKKEWTLVKEKMVREVSRLSQEKEEATVQIEAVKRELSEAQERSSSLIEELKKQLETLQQNIEQGSAELMQLKSAHEQQVKTLKSEITESEALVDQLKIELEEKEQSKVEIEIKLEEKLATLRAELKASQDVSQQQLDRLNEEKNAVTALSEETKEALVNATEKSGRLEAELANQQAWYKEQLATLQQSAEQGSELANKEIAQLKLTHEQQVSELKDEIAESGTLAAQLRKELEQQTQSKTEIQTNLEEELATLRAELKTSQELSQKHNEEKEKIIAEGKIGLDQATAKVTDLETTLETQQKHHEATSEDLEKRAKKSEDLVIKLTQALQVSETTENALKEGLDLLGIEFENSKKIHEETISELKTKHKDELKSTHQEARDTFAQERQRFEAELQQLKLQVEQQKQEALKAQDTIQGLREQIANSDSDSETSEYVLTSETEDELFPRHRMIEEKFDLPPSSESEHALAMLKQYVGTNRNLDLLNSLVEAKNNIDLIRCGLDFHLVEALEGNAFQTIVVLALAQQELLTDECKARRKKYIGEHYDDIIDGDLLSIQHHENKIQTITKTDIKIKNELSILKDFKPIHMLNPAFQEYANKNAREIEPKVLKLSEKSEEIITYLTNLRNEIKLCLYSLPQTKSLTANEHINAITEHKIYLEEQLKKVENELILHQPLQKMLSGDYYASNPLVKNGVLRLIKEAKSQKHSIKFLKFNSTSEDIFLTDKHLHLKADYVDNTEVVPLVSSSTVGKNYNMVARPESGKVRKHTIHPGEKCYGSFIEEWGSPDDNNKQLYTQTMAHFPTSDVPNDPAEISARVTLALAMATQQLAGFAGKPTKDNPIVLKHGTAEQLKYVWTALVALGKEVPHMKFRPSAIIIEGSAPFNPDKELGFFGGFKSDSCYETCFKKHPVLKTLMAGLKEADSNKYGHQSSREKTKSALNTATRILDKEVGKLDKEVLFTQSAKVTK